MLNQRKTQVYTLAIIIYPLNLYVCLFFTSSYEREMSDSTTVSSFESTQVPWFASLDACKKFGKYIIIGIPCESNLVKIHHTVYRYLLTINHSSFNWLELVISLMSFSFTDAWDLSKETTLFSSKCRWVNDKISMAIDAFPHTQKYPSLFMELHVTEWFINCLIANTIMGDCAKLAI